MQIVIELTDEQWKCVQDGTWCGTKEILNGKPLPVGHGRLIDEKDLSLMTVHMIDGMLVCDAPTIIEADGGDTDADID